MHHDCCAMHTLEVAMDSSTVCAFVITNAARLACQHGTRQQSWSRLLISAAPIGSVHKRQTLWAAWATISAGTCQPTIRDHPQCTALAYA